MRVAFAIILTVAAGHAYASCNTAQPQLCDPTQMQLIDLGPNTSMAYAVNAIGQAVGSFGTHSFLYSAGAVTALPEPLAAIASVATSINKSGQIVGTATYGTTSKPVSHALSWLHGNVRNLGSGMARAVNDSGAILGYYGGSSTLWVNYVPQPIASSIGGAYALSNNGEIVGADGGKAYIFSPATIAGGTKANGAFFAVNNRGEAVGTDLNFKSVLRYTNGRLDRLPGPVYGERPFPTALNDHGMIVGNFYTHRNNGAESTFLMEPTGVIYDLTNLYGFTTAYAAGSINNSGWIAGSAGGHAALLVWK